VWRSWSFACDVAHVRAHQSGISPHAELMGGPNRAAGFGHDVHLIVDSAWGPLTTLSKPTGDVQAPQAENPRRYASASCPSLLSAMDPEFRAGLVLARRLPLRASRGASRARPLWFLS
jgi:hypothetical protein